MNDFTSFAQSFSSHSGDDIVLNIDLDFKGRDSSVFPLGHNTQSTCTYYHGTFNGNGHRIKNLNLVTLLRKEMIYY